MCGGPRNYTSRRPKERLSAADAPPHGGVGGRRHEVPGVPVIPHPHRDGPEAHYEDRGRHGSAGPDARPEHPLQRHGQRGERRARCPTRTPPSPKPRRLGGPEPPGAPRRRRPGRTGSRPVVMPNRYRQPRPSRLARAIPARPIPGTRICGSGTSPAIANANQHSSTVATAAGIQAGPGITFPTAPAIAPSNAYVDRRPRCHAAAPLGREPAVAAKPPHIATQCMEPASPETKAARKTPIKGPYGFLHES
jgi:hypothetical protein